MLGDEQQYAPGWVSRKRSRVAMRRTSPSLQIADRASPVSRTLAASHPRRRMSWTAKRNEALALPRREAICWLASFVGTVATVGAAPLSPDRRARGAPIPDPHLMARNPRRGASLRVAGAAPRRAGRRRSRRCPDRTTRHSPAARGGSRAAGVPRVGPVTDQAVDGDLVPPPLHRRRRKDACLPPRLDVVRDASSRRAATATDTLGSSCLRCSSRIRAASRTRCSSRLPAAMSCSMATSETTCSERSCSLATDILPPPAYWTKLCHICSAATSASPFLN